MLKYNGRSNNKGLKLKRYRPNEKREGRPGFKPRTPRIKQMKFTDSFKTVTDPKDIRGFFFTRRSRDQKLKRNVQIPYFVKLLVQVPNVLITPLPYASFIPDTPNTQEHYHFNTNKKDVWPYNESCILRCYFWYMVPQFQTIASQDHAFANTRWEFPSNASQKSNHLPCSGHFIWYLYIPIIIWRHVLSRRKVSNDQDKYSGLTVLVFFSFFGIMDRFRLFFGNREAINDRCTEYSVNTPWFN